MGGKEGRRCDRIRGELLQLLQLRLRRDSSLWEGAFWYKLSEKKFSLVFGWKKLFTWINRFKNLLRSNK